MKEIIIIDGNNLLRKSNIKGSGEDDRLTLYEKVKSRLGLHQKCIFFFDGYGESSKDDIIFSYDKTADELMKNYIEKNYLREVITVISTDRGITEFAEVCSCKIKLSEKFWAEINNPVSNKNINQLYIPPEEYEKPERMSKKDLDEFRKYFS
ncbi:MAG: hypothetical protein OZ913_05345 [Ignavibacteriaceae bacterium]|jgi:Protein of unknown function (DUF901).|nr:MAG: YacP-like NYN domain protein [Chlorobi bacterium OLB4]MBW7855961.1 hypothetical protein [Ignavibacteria bacterium]MEB2329709.1 hypothetical protein [Ignavibacteriaceae bacterium]OQY77326.1 MAG: hypothetical protein B6D43_06865 [Ignavibacteriales bacterium UTCHB1]